MYHYFLVDLMDDGYIYRVGVWSDTNRPNREIRRYLERHSDFVMYEKTVKEVLPKYLKRMRKTKVGYIFCTKFLFDRCRQVTEDNWTIRLLNSLIDRQDKEIYIEEQ